MHSAPFATYDTVMPEVLKIAKQVVEIHEALQSSKVKVIEVIRETKTYESVSKRSELLKLLAEIKSAEKDEKAADKCAALKDASLLVDWQQYLIKESSNNSLPYLALQGLFFKAKSLLPSFIVDGRTRFQVAQDVLEKVGLVGENSRSLSSSQPQV